MPSPRRSSSRPGKAARKVAVASPKARSRKEATKAPAAKRAAATHAKPKPRPAAAAQAKPPAAKKPTPPPHRRSPDDKPATTAKPAVAPASAAHPAPAPKKADASRHGSSAAAAPSRPASSAPVAANAVPASPAPTPPPREAKTPPPPRRPLVWLTLVTRKSDLAIAQAELALARFQERLPQYGFKLLKLVTTGDRQESWSLEQSGGAGLFTSELEGALLDHRADVAVHSAKDLPTELGDNLAIAGYLPREDPRDVLVVREGLARPSTIATSSPRRRLQLQRQFTKATFVEIRGNVDTRLRKIAEENIADATVLAAAGLNRLGIKSWPGLRFQILPLAVSVPAAGQAAIAVQARGATADALRPHLDETTSRAVTLEREFLRQLGEGCHTALGVHYDDAAVHIFHESCGYQRFAVLPADAAEPARVATRIITQLKLKP